MRETSSPPSEMCFMAMCLRSRSRCCPEEVAPAPDQRTPAPQSAPGRHLVDRQRRRQLAEGVDLLLQGCDLLLGRGDGVGAGDEAAWRLLLVNDGQQRLCELGRV